MLLPSFCVIIFSKMWLAPNQKSPLHKFQEVAFHILRYNAKGSMEGMIW